MGIIVESVNNYDSANNFMKYFAHTIDNKPESDWHALSAHLKNTGGKAASFAHSDEFARIFKIAGYLHDFGKYQTAFQKYLREGGRRGSVPHASWGAGYALLLKNQEIAFTVDGHHKGLPDKAEVKSDVAPYMQSVKEDKTDIKDIIQEYLNDLQIKETELSTTIPTFSSQYERELFIRYMFSALTDADWLDTEMACNPGLSEKRMKSTLPYDELIAVLEEYIFKKPNDGEINKLRSKVREYALSKSELDAGFFSMNLPTGMGKTLASVSWALHHAKHNNFKRIIIVLPFINIIDQTSHVLKTIFGEDYILEHHSGIGEDIAVSENPADPQYIKRLACENWDYPVIVTTTVQFFESLFSNRPSKCRKIHNIADSVVIFDEVQSLPKDIILPSLEMLKNIQKVMKTSFLFCTATLPAFEKREHFDGIESITPLVRNPYEVFQKTRRVNYNSINEYDPVGFEMILETAVEQGSAVLLVFNTKKSARIMFEHGLESGEWDAFYHLSTAMCPIHRKEVIRAIIDDLKYKRKIFVSSTQLIEAGVDFDFPCVFREIAPLESIIQSAGRCNREGAMDQKGNVFIFCLKDSAMPDRQYKTAAGFSRDLIKENPDHLHRHSFYPEYYKKMMALFVDGDARRINPARNNFDFRTVNDAYRIIDKATKGLYIYGYNDDSEILIRSISLKIYLSRDDYRKMQAYTIQVYENFIIQNKAFIEVTDHGLLVWHGTYNSDHGIAVEPMRSDDFVV